MGLGWCGDYHWVFMTEAAPRLLGGEVWDAGVGLGVDGDDRGSCC